VASLAALYADSGLELEDRRQCCAGLRQALSQGRGGTLDEQLGSQARRERRGLEAAVASLDGPQPPPGAQAIGTRSRTFQDVFARWSTLREAGRLQRPLADVVGTMAHMAVNRLLRESGGLDELRVHDALGRLYVGQLARARPAAGSYRHGGL
jgi:Lantibiotic biosynthesis dehydratase C-term